MNSPRHCGEWVLAACLAAGAAEFRSWRQRCNWRMLPGAATRATLNWLLVNWSATSQASDFAGLGTVKCIYLSNSRLCIVIDLPGQIYHEPTRSAIAEKTARPLLNGFSQAARRVFLGQAPASPSPHPTAVAPATGRFPAQSDQRECLGIQAAS